MRLLLIRHGESEGNKKGVLQGHENFPLTTRGREQAEKLAELLVKRNLKIKEIHSSDLSRAVETALIINKKYQVPIYFSSALREHDLGLFSGKKTSEVSLRQYFIDTSKLVPGGESVDQMRERIEKYLDKILINSSLMDDNEGYIAIVAHGGTLYHIIRRIFNINYEAIEKEWFGNCKLQEVCQDTEGKWSLKTFNGRKVVSSDLCGSAVFSS